MVNFKDINPKDIKIKPHKKSNKILTLNEKPIEFQTPILTIKLIKREKNKILLVLSDIPQDFREFMGDIQERLTCLFKNSQNK